MWSPVLQVTYLKSASQKTKISVETAEKFVYQADWIFRSVF